MGLKHHCATHLKTENYRNFANDNQRNWSVWCKNALSMSCMYFMPGQNKCIHTYNHRKSWKKRNTTREETKRIQFEKRLAYKYPCGIAHTHTQTHNRNYSNYIYILFNCDIWDVRTDNQQYIWTGMLAYAAFNAIICLFLVVVHWICVCMSFSTIICLSQMIVFR